MQADATSLAEALLQERHAPPGVAPAGPCTLGLALSADDAATSAASLARASQQGADSRPPSCVPDLWRLLVGCDHPKVSATLLAAAAHVAPLCPAQWPVQPNQLQVPPLPSPDDAAAAAVGAAGGAADGARQDCCVAVQGRATWLAQQLLSCAGATRAGRTIVRCSGAWRKCSYSVHTLRCTHSAPA